MTSRREGGDKEESGGDKQTRLDRGSGEESRETHGRVEGQVGNHATVTQVQEKVTFSSFLLIFSFSLVFFRLVPSSSFL